MSPGYDIGGNSVTWGPHPGPAVGGTESA